MRLGPRLVLSLAVPLVTLTAVTGTFYHLRSRELLREELTKEGRAIALVASSAAEDYLRDRQFKDLQQLMDRITGYERVLGLRIFDRDGHISYQSSSLDSLPFRHFDDLRRVLKGGAPAEYRRVAGGQPALAILTPLVDDRKQILGAIQVIQLESYMEEDAKRMRSFILFLGAATVIAIVVIVSVATRLGIGRPAARLAGHFRDVGTSATLSRVPVRGDDEWADLAREFNGMCDRLDEAQRSLVLEQQRSESIETRLRNAERLVGLGRLASGLAHEIGTPLNVISGRAEAVLRSVRGQEQIERPLRIITLQIERISRTVRDMLDFARLKAPARASVNPEAALRSVLDLVEPRLERQRVKLVLDLPRPLPAFVADPDRLQQVFLNLALNAADAMPDGGVLRISAREGQAIHPTRPGPALPTVSFVFEDSGTGITTEDLDHVFDPFFTTKQPGHGTGLGLSVSYGIVEEHGGWFELTSEVGRGTRVTVHLPVTPGSPA